MSLDISALEPQIRQILSAPGTDLTTISAKRVRRRLLEIEPSLTAGILKVHKDAVDALIGTVFEMVQAEEGGSGDIGRQGLTEVQDSPPKKTKLDKEAADVDTEEDVASASLSGKMTKAAKKSSRELTDAELARQLSNEINSRSRRSTSSRGAVGSTRKGGRKMKSSELVDTDGEDSGDGERKVNTKTRGPAKGGFGKEYILRYVHPPVVFLFFSTDHLPIASLWPWSLGSVNSPGHRLLNSYGCISRTRSCRTQKIDAKFYVTGTSKPCSMRTRLICSG